MCQNERVHQLDEENAFLLNYFACFFSKSLALEYIRKHAVRLLRLREQHTPPRSVVVIVISLQLMHFLIHISWWKVSHYLSLSLLLLLGPET